MSRPSPNPAPPADPNFASSTAAAALSTGLPARFRVVGLGERRRADLGVEEDLLVQTEAQGLPLARLWHARPALVVPKTYTQVAGFDRACAEAAGAGWPVWVRGSGGGLVPLGQGVLNLSLAWRTTAAPGDLMEPVYHLLVDRLSAALRELGLRAQPGEVTGSFCDGRFNLALGGRKLVGTAQQWRRSERGGHLALAHALILLDADLDEMVAMANRFEDLIGSGRRYERDRHVTLREALGAQAPDDLHSVFPALLAQALETAPPPDQN